MPNEVEWIQGSPTHERKVLLVDRFHDIETGALNAHLGVVIGDSGWHYDKEEILAWAELPPLPEWLDATNDEEPTHA